MERSYRKYALEFHSYFDAEDVKSAEEVVMEKLGCDRGVAQDIIWEICDTIFDLDVYEGDEDVKDADGNDCYIDYDDSKFGETTVRVYSRDNESGVIDFGRLLDEFTVDGVSWEDMVADAKARVRSSKY